MEREVLLTGIGGQGVQLAAQVLARAATLEDRHVMLFGVYGGAMRGMNTDATVVVGDEPLRAPPLVSRAWAAVAMHDKFWEPIAGKVRPGGLILVNDATFETPLDGETFRVVRVPATDIADEIGSPMGGSMVMTGAFVGSTGLVTLDGTIEGMRESVPPYRTQHVAANERALRAGYERVERDTVPAWDAEVVT
jgi:2-oxoacid:acceptor oxidoreductase gamma subunit (pyruvate/2-ketoisovalerate family)